jgi:hypothetical protein
MRILRWQIGKTRGICCNLRSSCIHEMLMCGSKWLWKVILNYHKFLNWPR